MALRFANKIHCIVNNVVAQGLRLQAHALKVNAQAPPKTRYPLNQQDANSYIEQLKARAFARPRADAQEADVVRSFTVDVFTRPKSESVQQLNNGQMTMVQRFLATKAGKPPKKKASGEWSKDPKCKKDGGKKVDCKKGPAADAEKCPKLEDETCPKFKIQNCEQAKDPTCQNRKYIFTDCKKPLAPYPSFSEACYEPLPPNTSECKLCPWNPDFKHPTFKPPMNKFNQPDFKRGKGNKRKFHTDAARMVTLRFGTPVKTEKDRRAEELEKKLYDDLNGCLFEAKCRQARRLPSEGMRTVSRLPARDTQAADMFRALLQLKRLAEVPAPVNARRWEMLLRGPGFRHPLGSKRHKLRRRKRNHCDRPPLCPQFDYDYKDYDIKRKQRAYRRAQRKRKSQKDDCKCAGVEGPLVEGAAPVLEPGVAQPEVECAPRGRNMDQHKDMPKHKRKKLGARRHKMRRKKLDKCKPCKKVPYKPPIVYDIKKKRKEEKKRKDKKKQGSSSCVLECSGARPELAPSLDPLSERPDPFGDIVEKQGMWCKMVPKKPRKDGRESESLECDELAPSEVCPKTLLDRKPYPKYRKQMKKRLKKQKELEKKRRDALHYKEQAKKKYKKSPKKKAAGLGSEEAALGFFGHKKPHAIRPNYFARKRLAEMYVRAPRILPAQCRKSPPKFDFKPLPLDQCMPAVKFRTDVNQINLTEERIKAEEARMEETLVKLENMILAKNRVRVTGPAQCGRNECDIKKPMKKKKCLKKTKVQICPVDLLDRKPYKKFREGKKKRAKKHKKRHRKHGKRGSKKKKNKHGCAAVGPVDDLGEMSPALLRSMTARHLPEQPSV